MVEIHIGTAPIVILTRHRAFKFPKFWTERSRRWGRGKNKLEAIRSRSGDSRLCPVLYSEGRGWLIIMPRCTPPPEDKFDDFAWLSVFWGDDTEWPEPKFTSYGILDGKLVAIDYGNPTNAEENLEYFDEDVLAELGLD